MAKRRKRRVEVVSPAYQPSKAELKADVRVDATFEEAVKALARPVEVEYVPVQSHVRRRK